MVIRVRIISFKCIVIIFLAIYKSDAIRIYKLVSPVDCWSNQASACYDQGEIERNFRYNLPHLRDIGLKYGALHFMTKIRAKFDLLEFRLGTVRKSNVRYLLLNLYDDAVTFKEYSRTMGYSLACHDGEDCEQFASVNVTLKIHRNGFVTLDLGVNAAAYNSATCASIKVCLKSFTIIKSITRRRRNK